MNQFFYTRTEGDKSFRDSFNVNKVIRSLTLEDEKVLILIDDLHERSQEVPDINPKTNKMMGYKRKRDTFQSEIHLSKEDGERFFNLTNIEK
jgi:hypothetical protein